MDTAYLSLGIFMAHQYQWYRGTNVSPVTTLDATQLTGQMREGIQNITTTTTTCSDQDHIDFTQNFMGTDSRISDMHVNSSGNTVCGDGTSGADHDLVSTIDFGAFYSGGISSSRPIARACMFLEAGSVTVDTADVRLNSSKYWVNANSGCSSPQLDLQSVITHEAGHVYALADLEGEHENLTMFGVTNSCDTSKRTLGRGDIDGLEVWDP